MIPQSSLIREIPKKCPDCGGKHYIDPLNLNDYAETVEGFVHQSFCGDCGLMQPNLREDISFITNDEVISRGLKKKVAMRIGRSHGIENHLSKKLLDNFADIYLKKEFIINFSESYYALFGIVVSREEIKSFM